MDTLLSQISQSLQHAKSDEDWVRPLLDLVLKVTPCVSAYLTQVDADSQLQHVRYSSNTAELVVPEGARVPWPESLCIWTQSNAQRIADAVPSLESDAAVMKGPGERTLVTVPVHLADGRLYGTLCAVSRPETKPLEASMDVLEMFAQLIGRHLERERVLKELQQLSMRMLDMLQTDPLTQLPNQVAIIKALRYMLARTQRTHGQVWVAMMDLDCFKAVNDNHGHLVGNRVLCLVAQRLQQCLRAGDVVGRLSGDEFVMVTPGDPAQTQAQVQAQAKALRARLMQAMQCDLLLESGEMLHFGGGSLGVVQVGEGISVEEALKQADEAMYVDKRQRKAAQSSLGDCGVA